MDEQVTSTDRGGKLIRLTDNNLLLAVLIGLITVLILTGIYNLMWIAADIFDSKPFFIENVISRAIVLIRTVGLCVGPIVFILAFALLQRFRLQR